MKVNVRLCYSELWHLVFLQINTKVAEEFATYIYRIKVTFNLETTAVCSSGTLYSS
jgi:hypothetical protein